MVYFPVHNRTVLGSQVHETLVDKQKKAKKREKELHKIDTSLSEIRKESEIEKIESEYLVPEIKNWVETESVKVTKNRVKNWLSLNYPVHIIGPTG